jgi:tetratricopeptide (TPR) repeat protein/tRNA A-37 threonylcarbamoyl transferase component Bud32
MADVPQFLVNVLADAYRFERELGAGGMATVYLATDVKHRRQVAVKVLHPNLANALGPERFRREIDIAARLQHPHILPVFDSGEADGMLWYTMPFVEGESLRDRLGREGRQAIDAAMQIVREVAGALDYAHGQGVIHRDIKPENILLSQGHALVADFGIARAVQEDADRLTATGLGIGTAAYMSPEQALGEREVTAGSDVYSLASVAFEMLAGETPYSGPTALAIMTRRMTDPVPSARNLRPEVPVETDGAIMRALSTSAADRFQSAGEFATALTHAMATTVVRRRRWVAPAAVGGAAMAALAIFSATRGSDPPAAVAGARKHLLYGDSLLARRTPAAVGEAMSAYEAALALDSGSAAALARVGYAYALHLDWGWRYQDLTQADLRARAIGFSERAIAADSMSPDAWLTRAYVLAADDPYHLRGATDAFQRALALDSTNAEGWYQFGQALMVLGRSAEAESAYRRAFALDPNRPMSLMSLSAMYFRAGRLEEAWQVIDSAVAASRTVTSPYVRVVRGRIALMQGDTRVAHDEAELALAMDSGYTIPARSLLASVYRADGDSVRARTELTRVLDDLGSGSISPTSAYYAAGALLAQDMGEAAVSLLERARPRGATLWFYLQSTEFQPLRTNDRFRRVHDEADPRPADSPRG